MTGFSKRTYEMLVRVLVFGSTYPQYFLKGSQAAQQFADIQSATDRLSSEALAERSGQGALKASSGGRAQARAALRSQVLAVSRTAAALGVGQFWMPRDGGDRTLIEVGRLFASQAQPLEGKFLDGHLPADFVARLNSAVNTLEQAIRDQVTSRGTRTFAAAAISRSRVDAFGALKRLDPMVENLVRDDPAAFAVWTSARRIERSGPAADTARDKPPVTTSTAVSAQA